MHIEHFKIQGDAIVKHKIAVLMQEHIDHVVHHTTSMAGIVAVLNRKKKVGVEHLQGVKTFVASKCQMKGGSMPSDFYGYPHPSYAASHADAGVHASIINWVRQEARPSQGPGQSGGAGTDTFERELVEDIKEILKAMNLTASKTAITELKKIIERHVECFLRDIAAESPVTVKKLEKVLKKPGHAAFH